MENDDILKTGMFVLGVVILAPIVINGTCMAVAYTYAGIANGISKIKFNKKMKAGLKDGSIVKIDGKYYEVEVEDTKEEA